MFFHWRKKRKENQKKTPGRLIPQHTFQMYNGPSHMSPKSETYKLSLDKINNNVNICNIFLIQHRKVLKETCQCSCVSKCLTKDSQSNKLSLRLHQLMMKDGS